MVEVFHGQTHIISVLDYTYGSNNSKVESLRQRYSNTSNYHSFKQYATYDIDPIKDQHLQIMLGHEAQWGNWGSLCFT